jgi:hypothetical protein
VKSKAIGRTIWRDNAILFTDAAASPSDFCADWRCAFESLLRPQVDAGVLT